MLGHRHRRWRLFYGFPALPNHCGQPEVKVARHARGPVVDPSGDCRVVQETDIDDFLDLARKFLPDIEPARSCTCLYTNSPDGHFIIDRHPKHTNVSFGTASAATASSSLPQWAKS